MKRAPVKRNPVARALRDPAFRRRVVRARKGRGSYTRKGKEKTA
ncbi:MAG: ribosome alternative rescue factor ArfA [Alphaproteobacteria bacterium]|nr:ribosome alternative rescue factor ArfA [Alphaproteobacteria bacterium]